MKILAPVTIFCAASFAFAQAPQNSTSQADSQFVERAAQINMEEAHMGQLAQQQGGTQAVKDFGKTIEQEHKSAYQQLESIAQKDGFNIPKAIDDAHEKMIGQLNGLSGQSFDKKFRQIEMQQHEKAMAWMQSEMGQLQNADLKSYASDFASHLKAHSELTQELGNKQGGTGASAANQAMPMQTSGNGEQGDDSNANGAEKSHHATVVKYQAGQTLELKVRGRLGRHVYNLSDGSTATNQISDLKPGDKVTVSEMVDDNGRRSLKIEKDGAKSSSGNQQ